MSFSRISTKSVGGACRARVTAKLSQKLADPKAAEQFYLECDEVPPAGSKSSLVESSASPELP